MCDEAQQEDMQQYIEIPSLREGLDLHHAVRLLHVHSGHIKREIWESEASNIYLIQEGNYPAYLGNQDGVKYWPSLNELMVTDWIFVKSNNS